MLILRFVVWMFSVGLIVFGADVVPGQDYPNRPIRMVTTEPGGGADFVARLIAQGLSDSLGQQVIVENRGGAGGIIAAQMVTKAPPDGYTLLFFGSGILLLPLMQDNVPYDPVRDFALITLADRSPTILVVNPSVAANSVTELIALAKARPGALNYASGNQAGARERLLNSGVEAVGSSPEQFAASMKAEMVKWGKVIKDAGIRAD